MLMALTPATGQALDDLPFVERVEKADLDASRLQQADFLERRLAHAQDQVSFPEGLARDRD